MTFPVNLTMADMIRSVASESSTRITEMLCELTGVVEDAWFGDSPDQIGLLDALGNNFISRGDEMVIKLESNGVHTSFSTRVYEMPLGSWPNGI